MDHLRRILRSLEEEKVKEKEEIMIKTNGYWKIEFNQLALNLKKNQAKLILPSIRVNDSTKGLLKTKDGKYLFHCIREIGIGYRDCINYFRL
jgi:hypothetical protein